MRFLFKCLKRNRAYGQWIKGKPPPTRQLRSSNLNKWKIEEIADTREHLERLGCSRIRKLWNQLPWTEAGVDPEEATSSLAKLDAALPVLFDHLPELPLPHPYYLSS